MPSSWSQVDKQLARIAPGTSLLAARVSPDGTCIPVHAVNPGTPRPLASMFKLFVLGAVAIASRDHQVSWGERLTVTAAIKVGSSEALQDVAPGTKLTVERVALKIIEVSDNTAVDMLIKLVGRAAVEAQARQWSAHAFLDMPFLTVGELFTLKYHDFPTMADHYLALSPAQRAAYLTTTVDKVPSSAEQPATLPRDISSIEWFASAQDLCHAFSGLAALQAEPGLNPLSAVLSANNGGVGLSATTWSRIWFKGGSEPGVLTWVTWPGTRRVTPLWSSRSRRTKPNLCRSPWLRIFRSSTSFPAHSTYCGPAPKADQVARKFPSGTSTWV